MAPAGRPGRCSNQLADAEKELVNPIGETLCGQSAQRLGIYQGVVPDLVQLRPQLPVERRRPAALHGLRSPGPLRRIPRPTGATAPDK
jgi:hypothetical protein